MIKEENAISSLPVVIKSLVENTKLQETIIKNLDNFSYPDAAENIANEAIKMTNI